MQLAFESDLTLTAIPLSQAPPVALVLASGECIGLRAYVDPIRAGIPIAELQSVLDERRWLERAYDQA